MSKKEEPDMKRLFAILIALALLLGQTAVLAEGTAEATEGIRVGDYLTFGTWEQDNNKPNGTEPIEWLVLEVQGSKALVISRYGLVHTRYSTGNGSQTWYNSNIRGMLNDDFFYGAFTEEERAAILLTHVEEGPEQEDPSYKADESRVYRDTDDRIFLLSYAEMMRYLPTPASRLGYATEYIRAYANASDRTYPEGRTCWYWLRNPAYNTNASVVNWDGSFDTCVITHRYGVARPSCWVDLAALGLMEAVPSEEETPTLRTGGIVTFGRYEQDNDPDNGPEPIEWLVLEIDGETNRAMLISRCLLDRQPYNANYTRTTWEACTLRAWLNEDFLNAAFTPEEQAAIAVTAVDNGRSQCHPERAMVGNNTEDKVYLLSYTEVLHYMGTSEMRKSAPTAYAIAQGAWVSAEEKIDDTPSGRWWTRSPGYERTYAANVSAGGSFDFYDPVTQIAIAVRPVLWVDVSALGF